MSEPPPLYWSNFHKLWIENISVAGIIRQKKAVIVRRMTATIAKPSKTADISTILKSRDPLQALIKQKAYFQEIQAKQQMGFQKQMMEFLQSKRIHE